MITIILNHHNKYAEVDMPAMYEELQLALWKLGLDRVPEKYTLQDLEATFRYQSPLEYFVLRLLEGGMSLLDAVSAIYTVIAPPRPIMALVQILSSGFQSITELRQEIDRLIKSTAQFGSTCFFPVRGWLVGLDGEMEPARDAVMLKHAEVIKDEYFVQLTVVNAPVFELPMTGSIGATVQNSLQLIGAVILLVLLVYVAKKRRK